MDPLLHEILTQTILFAGAFCGTLMAAVSGGGAGFILLPLLILMGLPFLTALGTHKIGMLMLGVSSLMKHHQHGLMQRRIVLLLVGFGTPGSLLGTYTISLVDSSVAERILGCITIAMAVYSLFSKKFNATAPAPEISLKRYLAGGLAMFLVAFSSGSLSSGAGLFATLVMIVILRLDLKSAISYSMVFVASYYNLLGALMVGALGSIHWQWLPTILIACFSGGYLGAMLLDRLPVKVVKLIFCSVAALSGILLLYAA